MTRKVIVIGAGMGGLAAAARAAARGYDVEILEARPAAGGLASGCEHDGLRFDAGPYILLDRPGLEWAFAELGLDLGTEVDLVRLGHVYQVGFDDGTTVDFHADLERTAEGFERSWPGSGRQ